MTVGLNARRDASRRASAFKSGCMQALYAYHIVALLRLSSLRREGLLWCACVDNNRLYESVRGECSLVFIALSWLDVLHKSLN